MGYIVPNRELYPRAHKTHFNLQNAFDLPTGRDKVQKTYKTSCTVRQKAAWNTPYPIIRELMQNVMDYHQLIGADGLRKSNVTVTEFNNQHGIFRVAVDDMLVLTMTLKDNSLVLTQFDTFPFAPETLELGVEDRSKNSFSTAGGYGLGFKEALCALLARGGACKWTFYAEHERIKWTFLKSPSRRNTRHLCSHAKMVVKSEFKKVTTRPTTPYTFTQELELNGIGKAMRESIMPKISLFWAADERRRLRFKNDTMFACYGKVIGTQTCIPPGIYVKGLFVQAHNELPTAVIMGGAGSCIEVDSSDRNTVSDINGKFKKRISKILTNPNNFHANMMHHLFFGDVNDFVDEHYNFLIEEEDSHYWDLVFKDCCSDLYNVMNLGRDPIFVSSLPEDGVTEWAVQVLSASDRTVKVVTEKRLKMLFPPTSEDNWSVIVSAAVKSIFDNNNNADDGKNDDDNSDDDSSDDDSRNDAIEDGEPPHTQEIGAYQGIVEYLGKECTDAYCVKTIYREDAPKAVFGMDKNDQDGNGFCLMVILPFTTFTKASLCIFLKSILPYSHFILSESGRDIIFSLILGLGGWRLEDNDNVITIDAVKRMIAGDLPIATSSQPPIATSSHPTQNSRDIRGDSDGHGRQVDGTLVQQHSDIVVDDKYKRLQMFATSLVRTAKEIATAFPETELSELESFRRVRQRTAE